ncbi:hypothetical protein KC222_12960 [Cedecea davisae]|uniref:SWIM-type domain-containing protein n=1 Tax=Cedecea davisae TaxID=158484 RepID=A0ABS6DJC0_9ENTR|nr:hypothetical protein [Cedecea davisae]MBU4682921.1 hypothetical protein [Cedecea davisae]MBU4687980.1 hypothetical protein [Cedecea davisae]
MDEKFKLAFEEILNSLATQDERMDFTQKLITIMRLDDDQPCWCRSGKLHKDCHKKRESAAKFNQDHEIGIRVRTFKKKKFCSASFDSGNCDHRNISGAHTIQNNGVLSLMADNGHVGSLYQQVGDLSDVEVERGVTSSASIFHGFCRKHDDDLFKCIEKLPVALTAECLWASSYRAVCHEHYQKMAAIQGTLAQRDFADNGYSLPWQFYIQRNIQHTLEQQKLGLMFIKHIKDRFEEINKQPEGKLLGWMVTFDGPPILAVSGTFSPFYSLNGEPIQGGRVTSHLEHFSISTVMYEGNGAWIVSCLPEQTIAAEFLAQLFSRNLQDIMAFLCWAILGWSENVYFPLSWWRKLSDGHRNALLTLAQDVNCAVPYENQTFPANIIPQKINQILPFP